MTNDYHHGEMPPSESIKPVILLMNLGSPRTPAVKDVRRYLIEFLTDGRVISLPWLFRQLLVRGIIAPTRAPQSAKKYAQIWDADKQAFPLITINEQLAQKMAAKTGLAVYSVMRYGEPSVDTVLQCVMREQPAEAPIIGIPLYPQYAQSSYETAAVHLQQGAKRWGLTNRLRIVPPFYEHPLYIDALAKQIAPYLQTPFDKLILNYHGIPLSHLEGSCREHNDRGLSPTLCDHHADTAKQTCYRYHCMRTSELLTAQLQLPAAQVESCFQSRIGHVEWLKPYFAQRLTELPAEGCKHIVVATPGFVADCLETLEEVAQEGAHTFTTHGGTRYTYVPCLNDSDHFVATLIEFLA